MLRNLIIAVFVFSLQASSAQRKTEKAEELYEEALTAYRNRALSRSLDLANKSQRLLATAKNSYLTGLIYEAQNKALRAIAAYEAALILDSEYSEARFQKALIYLEKGDPAQALDDFNYLIEQGGIENTNSIFFEVDELGAKQHRLMTMSNVESRLYYYRGKAYERLLEFEPALSDYTQAIRIDSSAEYYVGRALLFNKIQKTRLAIEDLELAIAMDPENELAWYNLFLLDEATIVPPHLLTKDGFGPILSLLATRAMTSGNYHLAKKYLDMSIENNPEDALSHINRGRALMKMNQYQPAREDFLQAKSINPQRLETLYLTGNTFFYQKQYESALAYYNQYLTANPSSAMVWYNAAQCHLGLDNRTEACHFLERAYKFGQQGAKKLLTKYCMDEDQ